MKFKELKAVIRSIDQIAASPRVTTAQRCLLEKGKRKLIKAQRGGTPVENRKETVRAVDLIAQVVVEIVFTSTSKPNLSGCRPGTREIMRAK